MVAIKDMEMPKSCAHCDMTYEDRQLRDICRFNYTDVGYHISNQTKPADCPLVDIEEHKVVKCTDCEEYNQEKHYCPKFCDVIRDTTKEMQEFYKGEHEKLEKIEQIVKEQVIMPEGAYPKLKQIKQVLEQE